MRDAAPSAELSPKAETTKGSRERENHGTGSQPDSAAIRDPPAADRCIVRYTAIKQLFRDVKAALTPPAPAPEPQRKRRKEDTRGLFKVASAILHTTRTMRQHFRAASGRIFNTAANRRPALMRSFREMAATVRHTALPAHFFHDPGFSREERRAEAERVLRLQLDEWAQEADSAGQQTGFHYAAGGPDFDPHP